MTDEGKTLHKYKGTAKERLAGIKGARKWIQTLSDQHLLKGQDPVKDQPIPTAAEAPSQTPPA